MGIYRRGAFLLVGVLLLGISLTELIERTEVATVKPFLGLPSLERHDLAELFVLMPFDPHLQTLYTDHISQVAARLEIRVKRADDFFTANSIIYDIWAAIWGAEIILADCTGRNPNVFYEIGLAHTIGRPVVLITQAAEDIPFDLKAVRYIRYNFTPEGMTVLEQKVEAVMSEILQLPRCAHCCRRHR